MPDSKTARRVAIVAATMVFFVATFARAAEEPTEEQIEAFAT